MNHRNHPGFHRNGRFKAVARALLVFALWGTNPAQAVAAVQITLEDAIHLAVEHNEALKAARTAIRQNEAQEITADLRPNPVLSWDALNFPFARPGQYADADYQSQTAQYDLGIGYTWERGGKRSRRLQAARDQTALSKFQVFDNERTLRFNVAGQFINVLLAQSNLDLSSDDLKSFQETVRISETRYKSGDISQVDYLKIKLQLLQFQGDVNAARLAKAQALIALRGLLGYESVPSDYRVSGTLDYQPLVNNRDELLAAALKLRPDLLAARQGVAVAQSQLDLAKANSHQDLTTTLNLTHAGGNWTAGFLFSFPLGVFDRNQGEIARTRQVIEQNRHLADEARETVNGDVETAYEGVRSNEEIVSLYRSGYLDNARQSRDISEYAYKHGAASLLDFLDAERSYRGTQLAYRQALASYMLALEQLREAIGGRNLP